MKIVAGEASWEVAALEDLPLWAMVRLERELGLDEDALTALLGRAPDTAGGDKVFVAGVLVWMTRMAAGERIGFEDACDFPVRTLVIEMSEQEKAAAAEAAAAAQEPAEPGVRPTSPAEKGGA